MFISSMARQRSKDSSSFYNLRTLPSRGTTKRNPDEDFILRGRRTPVRMKPTSYRTNSDMTIVPSGHPHPQARSPLRESTSCQDFKMSDEEFDPSDLTLDLSDFNDGPEEELMRLQDDSFLDSNNADWFIKPFHRTSSPPVDVRKIARRQPLKAAVLSSNMEGNVTSDPSENIRKTPINQFNLSVFRKAEDHMLSSRTISALATPYQEELARLRLDRLRLEEEILLKKKCLQELERIRGPKPRWYELKTPAFHYEAKKNNDLLSLSGHYGEIMEYREQLLSSLGEEKIESR